MSISITAEQRDALLAAAGVPLRLIDEQNHAAFYLVEEASLLHLQAVADDKEEESLNRLRSLIQEGIDSPGVPASKAEMRLRALARQLAQGTE